MSSSQNERDKLSPGHGTLHCTLYGSKALFTHIAAQYPLKLISPQTHHDGLAAAYVITYGGGLITGDHINLNVTVSAGASLLLLTQGSTKIFKDREQSALLGPLISRDSSGRPASLGFSPGSSHTLTVDIASESTLLILPDPVTCFANSSYTQRQTFRLASQTSSLVLLDWYTSGRLSRGESWAFHKYSSRNDVYVEGHLAIRDSLLLANDNADSTQPTSYASSLAPYTCFATLILVGPRVASSIMQIQSHFNQVTVRQTSKPKELIWSANTVYQGSGMIVRIGGVGTERVKNFVKEVCLKGGVEDLVGGALFERII